ncbi:unnamed protein product [Orchesella dallaii]|uniref:Uncharacterized protein n=1 Tax=Orchesella dallaii TaxID=48710 RepID=A0ABP1Q4F2_9HEXA
MDRKIHLQLPNVSYELGEQIDSLTSSDLELDDDSEYKGEDGLPSCQCAKDASKNGELGDLYDILMELPSIKKAAWARRKAAVTSAKNSNRPETNQPSRNKVTFTRPCCLKKGNSSETQKNPSQLSTSHSTDSAAARQADEDSISECESENTRSRRELFKMQSINLYHTILPPSLFTNYPVNRRQF